MDADDMREINEHRKATHAGCKQRIAALERERDVLKSDLDMDWALTIRQIAQEKFGIHADFVDDVFRMVVQRAEAAEAENARLAAQVERLRVACIGHGTRLYSDLAFTYCRLCQGSSDRAGLQPSADPSNIIHQTDCAAALAAQEQPAPSVVYGYNIEHYDGPSDESGYGWNEYARDMNAPRDRTPGREGQNDGES